MIDTHCHLEKEDYDNIDEIIDTCKKDGIEKLIVSGHDLKSSVEAIELTKKYDIVYASIGFLPDVLDNIENNNKVVAIGEIGLDYHWYKDNKEEQKELLIKQLYLAKKYNKPVVIHSRDSISDCYNILKEANTKGAMHCYSGSVEMAGVSTFKNSNTIKNVIKEIPLEYILLETDSPYLTPEPFRGKKNYPYYVKYVAMKIAEIKGIDVDMVVNTTTMNATKLFDF